MKINYKALGESIAWAFFLTAFALIGTPPNYVAIVFLIVVSFVYLTKTQKPPFS
jgi:hypothetical protein